MPGDPDTAPAKDLVRRYLNDVFSRGDFAVMDRYLAGEESRTALSSL